MHSLYMLEPLMCARIKLEEEEQKQQQQSSTTTVEKKKISLKSCHKKLLKSLKNTYDKSDKKVNKN